MKAFTTGYFDIAVFIIQALVVIPSLGISQWLIGPGPGFFITTLFFIGLYLKRYDPDYVYGIAAYCPNGNTASIIPNIILYLGTFLCGFLLALNIIGGGLNFVAQITGIPGDVIFNHWVAILLILPTIMICPFGMYFLFNWARKNPETFLLTQQASGTIRFISRTGILLQSTVLMAVIFKTFTPSGGEPDILLSLIGAFFLTSIFYLPVRIHEFFQYPDQANWFNYFRSVIAIVCYQHSVHWAVFLLL